MIYGRTMQQAFDEIVTFMRKQGRQSRNEYGCVYRHAEGLRCAVGCLIPDEKYSPDMEGHNVWGDAFKGEKFTHSEKDFLIRMQKAHDQHFDEFPYIARSVASTFCLDPSVVDREFGA